MVRIAASPAAVVCALLAAASVAQSASIKHLVHRDEVPPPLSSVATREFADLSTRELLDLLQVPRSEIEDLFERSYDDVVELDAREVINELYERNFFKKIGQGFKKAFGFVKKLVIGRDFIDELETRDVAEHMGDIFERDFILEEELSLRDILDELDLLQRDIESILEREFFDEEVAARGFWNDEIEARAFDYDLD